MNRCLLSVFVLSVLSVNMPAGAMEMYRAQEIEPYRAQEVTPHKAQEIQPYQSQEVRPYQGEEVKPHRAQDVEQYNGDSVQPSGRQTDIQPIRMTPPLPPSQPAPQPPKQKKNDGAKALVGIWQTNIPGAVYTTPSGVQGYEILHVSSGAAAGLLRINANGTYSWNSYGGKKGKWVATGDGEYPIEIIDTVENRRWRVGYSSSKGALIIWSGSIWYEGRKATVKK